MPKLDNFTLELGGAINIVNDIYIHQPTIQDFLDHHIEEPQRNDIIAFHPQSCSRGVYFIKRIIGLPGDTIQINQNGDIIINNQIYQEKLDLDTILYTGIASEPIYIKQNEYFVLGDNRNNSVDSRFPEVGLVKKKDIIGKAIFLPTH